MMNVENFFKIATTSKEEGEEAAKTIARQLNVSGELFEAHRPGFERAKVLRPLPIAFGRERSGPFEVETTWTAAMHGGAEWERIHAALGV
jgi:hypothetical protein